LWRCSRKALPGVWSPRVTGRLAPTARASLHLAVYRLRAGDLTTAVKRDGQGSNSSTAAFRLANASR
jgi:hypothetical protein